MLSKYLPVRRPIDTSSLVRSPMPGTVLSVAVHDGDTVFQGQEIAVLEAMKMQNVIASPKAGKIKKVHVVPGMSVASDDTVVELESDQSAIGVGKP
jgi:propionyl-CoA carboxylase alpha chain